MEKLIINNKKSLKNQKNRNFFNKISIFLNKYIFPDNFKCIFCGKDVTSFFDKPYCESCEKILPFISKNRCLICSNTIKNEAIICDFAKNIRHTLKDFMLLFDMKELSKKVC